VTTIDKVTQVVMTSAKCTVGVDVETGKILWTYDGWSSRNPIPTATCIGDGRLLLTSIASYKSDCAMFRPQLKDGQWTVEELFKNDNCQSQMHNALLYEKHLYASSAANGKGLICMDLDGNVLWDSNGGYDSGSNLVIADGMIYIMDGGKGILHLVKASPDGYQELAKAQVLHRSPVWAPMAIADGKLLCRDQKQLKCLDIAK
jgi:outer membrane protein assembly factor BamB